MPTIRAFVIVFAAFALTLGGGTSVGAQSRVSVGVTETIETYNPYGDSVSLLYGIYSEITGPFARTTTPKAISKDDSPKNGKLKTRRPGFSR